LTIPAKKSLFAAFAVFSLTGDFIVLLSLRERIEVRVP
jgi:hypothetical protein